MSFFWLLTIPTLLVIAVSLILWVRAVITTRSRRKAHKAWRARWFPNGYANYGADDRWHITTKAQQQNDHPPSEVGPTDFGDYSLTIICAVFAWLVLFLSIFGSTTIDGRSKSAEIKGEQQELSVLVNQRQAVLDYLNTELTPEQVIAVANSMSVDNPSVQDVLNQVAAAQLTVARVENVIATNKLIFDQQALIRSKQRGICNNLENTWIPIIPAWYPDCDIPDYGQAPEIPEISLVPELVEE